MNLSLQHFLVCLHGLQLRRVDDSVPLTNTTATDEQLEQRSLKKRPCTPWLTRLSLTVGKQTSGNTPLNRYVNSLTPAARPGRLPGT